MTKIRERSLSFIFYRSNSTHLTLSLRIRELRSGNCVDSFWISGSWYGQGLKKAGWSLSRTAMHLPTLTWVLDLLDYLLIPALISARKSFINVYWREREKEGERASNKWKYRPVQLMQLSKQVLCKHLLREPNGNDHFPKFNTFICSLNEGGRLQWGKTH